MTRCILRNGSAFHTNRAIQPHLKTVKKTLQPGVRNCTETRRKKHSSPFALRDVDGECRINSARCSSLPGNKSELAVGYCTLYGDMCGGLAVISDVPKTMIYRLARWINREREIIPASSITKRRRLNFVRIKRPGLLPAVRSARRDS